MKKFLRKALGRVILCVTIRESIDEMQKGI